MHTMNLLSFKIFLTAYLDTINKIRHVSLYIDVP